MKHYVLLKLAPGADAVDAQQKLWKAYRKLDDALDWLNHPVVYRSCMDTDSSFDLMTIVEMEGEEQLAEYRAHPLVAEMAEALKPLIAKKKTFDHY